MKETLKELNKCIDRYYNLKNSWKAFFFNVDYKLYAYETRIINKFLALDLKVITEFKDMDYINLNRDLNEMIKRKKTNKKSRYYVSDKAFKQFMIDHDILTSDQQMLFDVYYRIYLMVGVYSDYYAYIRKVGLKYDNMRLIEIKEMFNWQNELLIVNE